MTRAIRGNTRRLVTAAGAAVLAAAMASAPAMAAAGDGGSCVARFVEPQAAGSGQAGAPFGATVRTFTVVFYPLGQTVSVQALSARDACPFQAP